MGRVHTVGRMDLSILETGLMVRGVEMESLSGTMERATKDNFLKICNMEKAGNLILMVGQRKALGKMTRNTVSLFALMAMRNSSRFGQMETK